jgi:Protein of unknown function (DUF3828)
MNRRQLLFAILLVPAPSGAAATCHAECEEYTAAEYVAALYESQARIAAKSPLSEEEFVAMFARDMRKLMRAPRKFSANAPDGPVLNAFFGPGVLPGTEVRIGKARRVSGKDSGPARVAVEIRHHGETHRIVVRVVKERGNWRIADITYDSGKSLADHYRAMTGHGVAGGQKSWNMKAPAEISAKPMA